MQKTKLGLKVESDFVYCYEDGKKVGMLFDILPPLICALQIFVSDQEIV